ncbi:MAG TPA: hypothetical protein H9830_08730 [Candidatus Agrococcus pullicola]|uniref:Uncharacterized protein n=1 Tax=Candidatus Agrococcus pullicola TaxID=2838429 RepID=A0A9D1YV27_9MICO|nr:hypothetical protein [Candidatus Agrococcus pullicola]
MKTKMKLHIEAQGEPKEGMALTLCDTEVPVRQIASYMPKASCDDCRTTAKDILQAHFRERSTDRDRTPSPQSSEARQQSNHFQRLDFPQSSTPTSGTVLKNEAGTTGTSYQRLNPLGNEASRPGWGR